MADRRICAANGHVYNLASNPPKVAGVCDLDGSPLRQRADDAEATVRARMDQQVPPLLEVVDHYRRRGVLSTVDGTVGIAGTTAGLVAALDARPRAPDRGHPQVPGRDRPDAPRRPRRRRGPRPHRGGDPAGRLDRRPGPHRRGPHRAVRRDPVLQGLPGDQPAGRSRPRSASRSTTRSSTGSPAAARCARARSSRSTPGPSSTAGTATPRGPSSSASRRRPWPS